MKPNHLRAPLILLGFLIIPASVLAEEDAKPIALPKELLQYLMEFSDENGELVDPLAIDAVMDKSKTEDVKMKSPSADVEKYYE